MIVGEAEAECLAGILQGGQEGAAVGLFPDHHHRVVQLLPGSLFGKGNPLPSSLVGYQFRKGMVVEQAYLVVHPRAVCTGKGTLVGTGNMGGYGFNRLVDGCGAVGTVAVAGTVGIAGRKGGNKGR